MPRAHGVAVSAPGIPSGSQSPPVLVAANPEAWLPGRGLATPSPPRPALILAPRCCGGHVSALLLTPDSCERCFAGDEKQMPGSGAHPC